MESKTPQFDRELDNILDRLIPHKRNCKWSGKNKYCEGEFEITKEDIEFLKMLRVPAPNFCPTCRRVRRLPYMNLSRLFKVECQAPYHKEMIISITPKDCPFPIYDYNYFIGDSFDAMSYGIAYKEGDNPLSLLSDLRKKFPVPSFLNRDPSSLNSEYSNGGRNLKNGYYAMACYDSEDVWYSSTLLKCKNIMDSRVVVNSEFIYEGLYSDHIYRSSFIYFSSNCLDSMFLFDCKNCSSCFGCVNLRNKVYCVYNEQLSKEDYELFIKSIYPLSRDDLKFHELKFKKLVKELPINATRNLNSINVDGVNIKNSKNLYNVVDANNSENIRYADGAISHKDSMDFLFSGGNSSMIYMCTNIGSQSNKVKFSVSSKFCINCEFIFNSKNLENCFMCFGLQNKKYCILNKQYEKEEYYEILDKIKSKMLQEGCYGDGVGIEFSAQAYNFSLAGISFPQEDRDIKILGGYVAEEPESNIDSSISIVDYSNLPKFINEIDDNILNKAIFCIDSKRPFKITKSELDFYKKMELPLPKKHPQTRMTERLCFIKDGIYFNTTCANCKKRIKSVFNTTENYILYCEKCYQKEVY